MLFCLLLFIIVVVVVVVVVVYKEAETSKGLLKRFLRRDF